LIILCAACDNTRVYEDYKEFGNRRWMISDSAFFNFQISDTTQKYNLKFNVRNSLEYPYARLFVNYRLSDPLGKPLTSKMFSVYLFDQKTGKPHGSSGLGDIYDNQFPLVENYVFHRKGNYHIRFEQFMRMDTLPGILAAGVRVEMVPSER
jgi:gliding motility-associated lipoprotein GldH